VLAPSGNSDTQRAPRAWSARISSGAGAKSNSMTGKPELHTDKPRIAASQTPRSRSKITCFTTGDSTPQNSGGFLGPCRKRTP
jgi:hypothetical protein